LITLLTDFGLSDGYVAAMKGVILSLTPQACVVDVSHAIEPGAISSAAYLIYSVYRTFPEDTVHVIVVDPGVGTERRALAHRAGGYWFVAPDNGVLSLVCDPQAGETYLLENSSLWRQPVSATFHGRDVFAPVAARLAGGMPGRSVGPLTDPPQRTLSLEPKLEEDGQLVAEVLHIDRFGNVITSLRADLVSSDAVLDLKGKRISTLKRTFADAAPGELLAYVGSSGLVEVAVRDGNAARLLGVSIGDQIRVRSVDR